MNEIKAAFNKIFGDMSLSENDVDLDENGETNPASETAAKGFV